MSPGSGCLWMTVWEWPTLISSLTPSSQSAPQGPSLSLLVLGKVLMTDFLLLLLTSYLESLHAVCCADPNFLKKTH